MSNKEIAAHLSLLANLMEIHNEEPFRVRSFANAAFRIRQLDRPVFGLSEADLLAIPGIGKVIASAIAELMVDGSIRQLDELESATPEGILEMVRIKGIGAKKIHVIWKTIGIDNLPDLLAAIDQNKLIKYPGFGARTQQNIKEAISFYLAQRERLLYAQAEKWIAEFLEMLQPLLHPMEIKVTGEARRHCETVGEVQFLVQGTGDDILKKLKSQGIKVTQAKKNSDIFFTTGDGISARIVATSGTGFLRSLFTSTGPEAFVRKFDQQFPDTDFLSAKSETGLFDQAGISEILPFMRDTEGIIPLAVKTKIPKVIEPEDVRGLIHCHTTWSDGVVSIEEMAQACMSRGLEYMVLSDHSKAAFYANGLDENRVALQQKEVDRLNKKLAPFKIFKSIECDILADGRLDYEEETLQSFDLVIASIHSNLKMSEDKATTRLLRAIENPYTTILGHMTGRLLLMRPGYMPDHKAIIDACALHGVVIEVNANPRRLDMRWQWIPYAVSKGVLLSINPDAHSREEIDKIRYGVLAAQKGLLTAERNLSSFSLEELEEFIAGKKRKKKG